MMTAPQFEAERTVVLLPQILVSSNLERFLVIWKIVEGKQGREDEQFIRLLMFCWWC